MFFIHPMWDTETQRIGQRRCTPWGYRLRGVAELIGYTGLLLLVSAPVYAVFDWLREQPTQGWLMAGIACSLGVVSQLLFRGSGWLATRKQFHYDDDRNEASWIEHGERVTYRWPPGDV